ncbi:MAG: helix-turn-helix transcriptional regulator [Clostridia bacterium]|nr:helix-turn-helix transcriptional regulator [Clostridia bacterium]
MAYYGKLEWLEKIRVAKGYSQDRVAAMAGISQGMYSKIELGYRDPTPEQAASIAEALEFDAGRFAEEGRMRGAAV